MPRSGGAFRQLRDIFNWISGPAQKRQDEMRFFAFKLDDIEGKISSTQHAMEKFSEAIEVYATHLASHTSAIQELSRSASELRESSAEQNRVLARITQSLFTEAPRYVPRLVRSGDTANAYRFIKEMEERTEKAETIKYSLQGLFTHDIEDRTATAFEAARRLNRLAGGYQPEGCTTRRRLSYREAHAAV